MAPVHRAVVSRASLSRPSMTTRQPAAARSAVRALPNPLEAPVTMAVLVLLLSLSAMTTTVELEVHFKSRDTCDGAEYRGSSGQSERGALGAEVLRAGGPDLIRPERRRSAPLSPRRTASAGLREGRPEGG